MILSVDILFETSASLYSVYHCTLLCNNSTAVAPSITIPPEDTVVKEGESATFTCIGAGIPQPSVKWYDEFGSLLVEGPTLVRENVEATRRNAQYICVVTSDAGSIQATASLIVYSKCLTPPVLQRIFLHYIVSSFIVHLKWCNFLHRWR